MKSINTLLAVAVFALSATQLSCSVNDYCLNCATGDGGMGSGDGDANDGGGDIDAPPDAGCVPTGSEICDGDDNDCNGLVDDGVLPEVDDPCANQLGACSGGTKICTAGQIKCTKNAAPEVCDFIDNNCNGTVDEGDPGGGGKCGTDQGECIAGTLRCQSAAGCDASAACDPLVTANCCVKCTGFIDHRLDDELCNGKDDNCNSQLDEGLSNLGACTWAGATDNGACNIGTLSCVGAVPVCSGAVFPTFEVCNNIDDDCNNSTDEIFNKLTDPTNCGACGNVCGAKSKTCTGGTNARLTCTVAGDCPGGTCDVNSQPKCASNGATPPVGTCGFQCNVGYINLDGQTGNGCEYKCSPTGNEECDGIDNDCDGLVDELLSPPPGLCLTQGVCTNSVASCMGNMGWRCNYPATYEAIEVTCDTLNNDCDSNIDESQPNLTDACSEVPETTCTGSVDEDLDGRVNDGCAQVGATGETGAQCANSINDDAGDDSVINDGCPAIAENGVCKSAGTYQCNPANLTGPARCVINQPGMAASAESCDAKDNDCDGGVDEGASTGSILGQEWITLGAGKQIMRFEASRPDATSTDIGSAQTTVCSRQNVQPWTNVKYPEAVAACASVGARLCTESEWHHACSVVAVTAAPSVSTAAAVFVEAEDYSSIAFATGGAPSTAHSWVPDYTTGFSGISAMEATPNSANGGVASIGNALAQSPRMSWLLNFTANSATYHIWVKAYQTGLLNNNNELFVGLSANTTAAAPTATVTLPAATACTVDANCTALAGGTCVDSDGNGSNDKCAGWQWVDAGTFNVTGSPVSRLASVFMSDDGVKIDKIAINTSGTAPVDSDLGEGGIWAYSANPNTYAAATCNGADRVIGDNDPILSTGALPQCFANTGTGIFDMSGNVKEWTAAHVPGENPIRGGASNNLGTGISCPLNFTLADDSFFFPNIGFRCCR